MINSLILNNFQSHKHSGLEFDPGLNVIIGPSDSGKTAIIRAMRWVVWNRPLGNAMCSNWGGETSIEINANNISVIRKEGKEKSYLLNDLEFKAFGTSVPDEIVNALNLSEINLQSQLDAPFLLSQSAGEVAQHFNRIANLDKIDTGLQNIQSWIKKISKDIDYKNTQLEQNKTDLEKFDYLEKFETDPCTLR